MFAFTEDSVTAIFTLCGVIIASSAGIFTLLWKNLRTTNQLNKSVNERGPGELSILEMVIQLYEDRGANTAMIKHLDEWKRQHALLHKKNQDSCERIERLLKDISD